MRKQSPKVIWFHLYDTYWSQSLDEEQYLGQSFSTLALLRFGARKFCCGGFPVQSKMCGSILDLYPLDTNNNSSSHLRNFDNQKCVHILPNVPWGAKLCWLRTTGICDDRGRREIIPIEKEGNMCGHWRNWVNLQIKYEKH